MYINLKYIHIYIYITRVFVCAYYHFDKITILFRSLGGKV